MKTVVTKYEAPLMRSNANPRRYNDPFATMLAAVAAASFATISGPAAIKPATPARMQSNQQAPAILAWRTGDSFLKRAVSSDSLIVVPPDSSRIQLRSLKFEMFESTAMNTQAKEPQGWEGRLAPASVECREILQRQLVITAMQVFFHCSPLTAHRSLLTAHRSLPSTSQRQRPSTATKPSVSARLGTST